jgi:hypothetical protein
MEMEKTHYLVVFRPAYLRLIEQRSVEGGALLEAGAEFPISGTVLVTITQGGFGQDIVDDERQVRERFLEYMFASSGLDIPRSAESFDDYFELKLVDEIIDLDDES